MHSLLIPNVICFNTTHWSTYKVILCSNLERTFTMHKWLYAKCLCLVDFINKTDLHTCVTHIFRRVQQAIFVLYLYKKEAFHRTLHPTWWHKREITRNPQTPLLVGRGSLNLSIKTDRIERTIPMHKGPALGIRRGPQVNVQQPFGLTAGPVYGAGIVRQVCATHIVLYVYACIVMWKIAARGIQFPRWIYK